VKYLDKTGELEVQRLKRRLGIFVFFDYDGIADCYLEFLLDKLSKICQQINIVVNGEIQQSSLNRLYRYADRIYIRENIGFDAGAYKDFFLKVIPKYEWESYDEIVLMNDTFFGPIIPLEHIWSRFEAETIDFWGITRHPKGEYGSGEELYSHIQAYFMVIGKRIIESPSFLEFWENIPYPQNYQSAVIEFEIQFTNFFEKYGFNSKSLMDASLFCKDNEGNPYLHHSYELIKYMDVPFLKKKCLMFENPGYINAIHALEYIEVELKFNTDMIWENIYRLSREKRFGLIFNYCELEKFYKTHKQIFIYGAGNYGKKVQRYFQYRKWTFEGFLVSENVNKEQNCKNYAEMSFKDTDGIILALGKSYLAEVLEKVSLDLKAEQLLVPYFIMD